MILPLTYHRYYSKDAAYYFRWYQARLPGLGKEFLDELGLTLAEIEANSKQYALVTATIRQAQVSRFPFSIFYRVKPDRVRILAVWHNKRGSSGWKYRR